MDFVFFSVGLGCLILSLSYSYKILAEVNIKKRAFNKSMSEIDKSFQGQNKQVPSNDELIQRLENFRQQKFALKTNTKGKSNATEEGIQGR